jgi:hypothetical protein
MMPIRISRASRSAGAMASKPEDFMGDDFPARRETSIRWAARSAVLLVIAFAAGCGHETPTAVTNELGRSTVLTSRSAVNCQNIRGAMEGNFAAPGGFTMQSLGTAEVTVVGIDAKGRDGQGAIHTVVTHLIHTSRGTISTTDEGVLAPVDPPLYRLNHRWTITGGTGDFEDASGFLHPHALIDLATGEIDGFFHGRICA